MVRLVSAALLLLLTLIVPGAQAPPAPKPLEIYFVDVEGGQATLFKSPSGESMLVDAGFPGLGGRDAGRIEAAMKRAGVSRIDYLVVTHYHGDHVGGVPAIAARFPIGTFVDHGPTVESSTDPNYTAYLEARKSGRHLQVKPGDNIPVAGMDVTVVSAGGDVLAKPLSGAGHVNPACKDHKPQEPDPSENARSVGIVISYGNFRMLDLGDLTWNKEYELACPVNKIGLVDLYLTTHHGNQSSGPPALVHGVMPRVAIMNNGSNKGGQPPAWRIVRGSPGLEDFWQLHFAVEAGKDFNAPDQFIANVDESTANDIRVSAERDGSFMVTNTRNALTKKYAARVRVARP